MKVIFITRSRFYQYVGMMYISSALNGLPIERILSIADEEEVLKKCISSSREPVVLAYSVSSYDSDFFIAFNRKLKRKLPNAISVFGGPHPTFYPDMIYEETVDVICRGEGEAAFRELCEAILRAKEYDTIYNLWVKKNCNEVVKNKMRPLEHNLSKIAFPDRKLFYSLGLESMVLQIIANRGCPYACSFCYNDAMRKLYRGKGNYVRLRDVANLIAEIHDAMQSVPLLIKRVMFLDSVFTLSKPWLREFAQAYNKEIPLPFSCAIRADITDEETIALLKDAGCSRVAMGVEVGDEQYRCQVLKKEILNEDFIRVAQWLKKYKIKLKTLNMVGFPNCSLEDDLQTMRLNWQIRPTYAHASLFVPLPGTELYNELEKSGKLERKFGYEDNYVLMKKSSNVKFDTKMQRRQVENFHKFFALSVQFPFLFSLIRLLILWPLNSFYYILSKWYGYFMYACVMDYVDIRQLIRKYNIVTIVGQFHKQAIEQ